MKIVKFYTGSVAVELCYQGYNWLTSLETLNAEAKKLQVDARRICKAIGIHNEWTDYSVEIDFTKKSIFVSPSCNGNRETCLAFVKEAQKRHFKWPNGKDGE